MKHIYMIVIALCVGITVYGMRKIIDKTNVTDSAAAIFDTLGIPYSEKTVAALNQIAQKNLIRRAGSERWEMENKHGEHRAALTQQLRSAGMIDEMVPARRTYDYALILGAASERMSMRINWLTKLRAQGLKVNKIVLLTGDRPASAEVDDITLGKTETEIMRTLADRAGLFKDTTTELVSTPMITENDGKVRRPTTDDTIITWLKTQPEPGTCLVVSNQPYLARQLAVVEALVRSPFVVEGAGEAASSAGNLGVYLDEFARLLYCEAKAAE